ncbi:MAG: nucleotide exchange factor GrpE [Candidatus Limnocylindrales bacterium]
MSGVAADQSAAADPTERLERLVRGMARESLEVARGQREIQASLQGLPAALEAVDLSLKGVSQQVWRYAQDGQAGITIAEEHFAGAIRELEARLRAELQSLIYRNACLALLPALDDLDLVIGNQRSLQPGADGDDHLLQAVVIVRHKLAEGLRALGLEEIPVEAGRTTFDPTLHQAVESDLAAGIPAPPDLPPDLPRGTILMVRRAGYRLNGGVLRTPQVIIAS